MGQEQRVIIDGYNVIYTDDELRRIACKDLEGGRRGLIAMLSAYVKSRRIRMTLIFDGRGGLTEGEVIVPGKLQVIFSSTGQSADEVIVKTVLDSGNPRQFLVVTSDQADIGSRLRPVGCQVMGSKRFLERVLKHTKKGDGPRPRKDADHAEIGDTDYWLERFEEDGERE